MTGKTLFRIVWTSIVVGMVLLWASTTTTVTCVRSKMSRTPAVLKDLTFAIKTYQVEYNRYPIQSGSQTDQRLESTGRLLGLLIGEDVDGLNPRKIAYIDPPEAVEGHGGLIRGTGLEGSRLVDYWGHPYVIWIDGDHDNRIPNPDAKNTSPDVRAGAPAMLNLGILAYSLGPDGIEGTRDDLVSWRDQMPKESSKLGFVVIALLILLPNGLIQWLLLLKTKVVRWFSNSAPEAP